MREIKFRVWDNISYMSNPFTLNDLQLKLVQFADNCIVMQYTGLKDKNGKELYEGDIYIEKRENMISGKTYKSFQIANYKTLEIFKGDILSNLIYWEIIGNKYENPELLKWLV